jgi:hypothetical protein
MNLNYLTIAIEWSIKTVSLLYLININFFNKNTCCWLKVKLFSYSESRIDNILHSKNSFDCYHSQNSMEGFLMETKYWKYLNNTVAQKSHHKEHCYGQQHHCFLLMVIWQKLKFLILMYWKHFAYHLSFEPMQSVFRLKKRCCFQVAIHEK